MITTGNPLFKIIPMDRIFYTLQVKNGDVEIRYAIPTTPTNEHTRFCHLIKEYFLASRQVKKYPKYEAFARFASRANLFKILPMQFRLRNVYKFLSL